MRPLFVCKIVCKKLAKPNKSPYICVNEAMERRAKKNRIMQNESIKKDTKVIIQVNENGKKRFRNATAYFNSDSTGVYVVSGGLHLFAWFEGKVPRNIRPIKHFTVKEVLKK